MPKKTAVDTIDPRSAEVVLAYVGDGRPVRNVPARDLSQADLARLVYVRALAEVAADVGRPADPDDPEGPTLQRPDPLVPDPASVAALLEELTATGNWTTDTPPVEPAQPEAESLTPPVEPAQPEA